MHVVVISAREVVITQASDRNGSLERAFEHRGTLYARSRHPDNRASKRMLNGRARQEAWPNVTMLASLGALRTYPSFRRLGNIHDVTHLRQAGPGSVRPWPRQEEQKQADRGSAAASLDEGVRD